MVARQALQCTLVGPQACRLALGDQLVLACPRKLVGPLAPVGPQVCPRIPAYPLALGGRLVDQQTLRLVCPHTRSSQLVGQCRLACPLALGDPLVLAYPLAGPRTLGDPLALACPLAGQCKLGGQ